MRRKTHNDSSSASELAPTGTTSSVHEHIARLQQRQLEMVQQTAQDLEVLKHQLEKSEHVERLEAEVARLKAEREHLERSVHTLQDQLVTQQEQSTTVVNTLTTAIRTHLKNVQGFAAETENYLKDIPSFETDHTQKIQPLPTPVSLPTPKPVHQEPRFQKEETHKPARTFSARRFAVRTVAMALIAAAGYGGFRAYQQFTTIPEQGSVAGVSTVSSPEPSMQPYAESYANIPFIQTSWKKLTDADFGVSFEYPENSSNVVHTAGTNNLWVLRNNSYLLRVNRIETTLSLDAWWIGNQEDYTEDATVSKTTFKGQPAYYVESKQKNSTSGSSYFQKRTSGIYQIWIKDESASSDDGQRLTHMIDTFNFID